MRYYPIRVPARKLARRSRSMSPDPPTTMIHGVNRPVSRIALGCMLLSVDGRPDRARAKDVIRGAIEAGLTVIDTADVYALDQEETGHNERLIAEALAELGIDAGDGSPVLVATKGGMTRRGRTWSRDGRPEHIVRACHASLRALNVERIGLYQLHTPDERVPFDESVGALAELKGQGKVAAVGLSNVTLEQIREAETIVPVASVQNHMSVWDVGYRRSRLVAHCASRGILFFAYAPLGGRERCARLSRGEALTTLAGELGVSPQELSLAWLIARAPVVVPIAGATRRETVESCSRAAQLALDASTTARVGRALRRLPGHRGLLARVASRLFR